MNRGLIEALRHPSFPCSCPLLPRFMNRGLIEAVVGVSPSVGVSPLPRFMNRGLIEARVSLVTPATGAYFPDS